MWTESCLGKQPQGCPLRAAMHTGPAAPHWLNQDPWPLQTAATGDVCAGGSSPAGKGFARSQDINSDVPFMECHRADRGAVLTGELSVIVA